LLPPKTTFNPYAQLGTGISLYKNYVGMYIPAGIGCQVNFTPDLFMLINSQYRFAVTTTQHRHFFHSIGLAGTITRKKINKTIPAPPPPVVIAQPIDSDGDGLVDSVDQCPTVIGVAKYHGCPVPDRDGDRINDEEDQCPDVKGVPQYKGCPVPDKDQDGIEDAQDECPDTPGNAGNNGCPEIKASLQKTINLAAKHIFFATGKYELLPTSFAALNEVVKILRENPALQLHIEGHTDNTGTPEKNQVLSEHRAGSVLHYLQKAGIPATRMHAAGYGQQRPVAENNTAKGRAANRRVELEISY
jgi:OOP family OmpA-OmpF porin